MQNKYKICQFFKCFLYGYLSISVGSIAQLSIYSPVSDSTLGIISFELRVLGFNFNKRSRLTVKANKKRSNVSLLPIARVLKIHCWGQNHLYICVCLVRVILSFPTRRHYKTYLNVTQTGCLVKAKQDPDDQMQNE